MDQERSGGHISRIILGENTSVPILLLYGLCAGVSDDDRLPPVPEQLARMMLEVMEE